MKKIFVLSPFQWEVLTKAFSNISQGVILFSLAAFFVPETVGLIKDFSRSLALLYLLGGFMILTFAIIIGRKGD